MVFDDVHLQVVVLSELFVSDRADNLSILPDMLYRLPVNLYMDLPVVLLEVEVLCELLAAHSALKRYHFYCLLFFVNRLLIFIYLCLFLIDNKLCNPSFFWIL